MGTRRFVGTWRQEKGHKIVKKVFAETEWITYDTLHGRVYRSMLKQSLVLLDGQAMDFGKGLLKLGMVPSTAQSKAEFEASDIADTLLLWENTSAEWCHEILHIKYLRRIVPSYLQQTTLTTCWCNLG